MENVQDASSYPVLNFTPSGHQLRPIFTKRLDNFISDGQFEALNLRAMLDHARTNDPAHVDIKVWSPPGRNRPPFAEAVRNVYRPTHSGELFGPSWTTHWFKIELQIPRDWKYEVMQFEFDCESEGMVYTLEGEPMQGLTGGSAFNKRHEYILSRDWHEGCHTFYIEASMNNMSGNAVGPDDNVPPTEDRTFVLQKCDLVAPNSEAQALLQDFVIISDCARELPQASWESNYALQIATEIINTYDRDPHEQETILRCRKLAQKFLGSEFNSGKVYDSAAKTLISAVGHCHIDTAWLWPFSETKRKVARSWGTQLDLMERYPEHRFTCSQAQQYKWLLQDYPSLFARVQKFVKKGMFEPIGGAWVEMDGNMPSGEAMARQFLYGQRFFQRHFGMQSSVCWLPDSFGYCAQLPQISRLSGMKYAFTQKLSWSNINTFPHTTFNWVSLDGSQLLMHMTPNDTYTSQCNVRDLLMCVNQHKNLNRNHKSLLVFGNGDGGGGPQALMLEKLRRCRGVSDTIGALPRVEIGETVTNFYERLDRDSNHGRDLSTWHGELYLEFHRGTYTSQSKTKRNNRKSEVLLHDLEFLSTIASLSCHGYKVPKKDIDQMWEDVLLCQFHDVLPGTSIEMVYEDADRIYTNVQELGEKLLQQVLEALNLTSGNLTALNCLPWPRKEVFGTQLAECTPAIATLSSPSDIVSIKEEGADFILSNKYLTLTLSHGVITSLYDLENERQVICSGAKAGQFVIFDDKSLSKQAWATEVYSLDTRKELHPQHVRQLAPNPAKAGIEVHYKISERSSFKAIISLSSESRQVDFACTAIWHEHLRFLKVEFPLDVVSSTARYETQFGLVERPTHFNTTWDHAKFEVCGHKFADLSEHDYGVAILNDCKYGFATHGKVMRLSLLRAPKAPDAHADMGEHEFKFSILPHRGPLNTSVVRAAKELNSPMRGIRGTNEWLDAFQIKTNGGAILESIKRGEDDEDISTDSEWRKSGKSVILRLYDALGGKTKATILSKFPVKSAAKTNLLEEKMEDLTVDGGHQVKIELRPFEIFTVKLEV